MSREPDTAHPSSKLTSLSDTQLDSIETARRRAEARAERRELATEATASLTFVLAALACLALAHPAPNAWLAAGLTLICAVLMRIEFEVGEGCTRPVQLAVVPMLLLLPAPVVPILVGIAHVIGRLPDVLAGRAGPDRLLLVLADSWFSIAPALVFVVAGSPSDADAQLLALCVAVAAQIVTDFGVSALRMWFGVGVGMRSQLAGYAWVYTVDLLMTPIGLLAAWAGDEHRAAVAGVLPFAALMTVFARERRERLKAAIRLQHVAQEGRDRLQSMVQHSSDLIAILDTDGTIQTAMGRVEPIFGGDGAQVEGEQLLHRVLPEDVPVVAAFLGAVAAKGQGESQEAEWRMRYADGSFRHIAAVATNLLDDERVAGLALTARDIDARKAFEEQLRHRAFHDPLTGLANRSLFYDRIEHALTRSTRDGAQIAVLFIDLDDFKLANDRHGHAAGDELLQDMARRLLTCVRSDDTAARLGGDEFGVLLENVADSNVALKAAQRILESLRPPFGVGEEQLRLSASVGIAVSTPGERGVDELLRRADLAMYEAKRFGKGRFELYHAGLEHVGGPESARGPWFMRRDEQREELVSVLEDPDGLTMVFQPIMDLRTGRVAGYESLARINRAPQRAPNLWFADAHRFGLGYALEAKALAAALATPGRPPGTYLAVNLSPSSLVADEIQQVLPERLDDLVVEVTENELVSGAPEIAAGIAALRERGARVAVDDTGAGYAGLTHVMRLAPDIIKLDRSVTTGVDGDPVKAALIASFVRYAREIGATICGEGIESLDELLRLADLDVAYGQGYRIARPAPPWSGVEADAAHACLAAFRSVLDDSAAARSDGEQERRLELLSVRLSRATSDAELAACLDAIAEELAADEVRISHGAGKGAVARQLLADDPAVDPEDVAGLLASGYRSVLTLPIGRAGAVVGRLDAYSRQGRPWTRFEIGRGRIISHQLGDALQRIAPAAQLAGSRG